MTLQDFIDWCSENGVSRDAEMVFWDADYPIPVRPDHLALEQDNSNSIPRNRKQTLSIFF